MKTLCALVVVLLMTCPAYSRQRHHALLSFATFRAAAVTAAQNSSDTNGDSDMDGDDSDDESDDMEMDTDNETDDGETDGDTETDDMDMDGTDGNEEMETEDEDADDMEMNGDSDDESGDADDDMNTNTVNSAIRAALKAAALRQLQSPQSRLAAALNAGLGPRQTVGVLLDSADTAGTTSAGTILTTNSSTTAGGLTLMASTAGLTASTAAAISNLSATAIPEPAAWILAATGLLTSLYKRRRP